MINGGSGPVGFGISTVASPISIQWAYVAVVIGVLPTRATGAAEAARKPLPLPAPGLRWLVVVPHADKTKTNTRGAPILRSQVRRGDTSAFAIELARVLRQFTCCGATAVAAPQRTAYSFVISIAGVFVIEPLTL